MFSLSRMAMDVQKHFLATGQDKGRGRCDSRALRCTHELFMIIIYIPTRTSGRQILLLWGIAIDNSNGGSVFQMSMAAVSALGRDEGEPFLSLPRAICALRASSRALTPSLMRTCARGRGQAWHHNGTEAPGINPVPSLLAF